MMNFSYTPSRTSFANRTQSINVQTPIAQENDIPQLDFPPSDIPDISLNLTEIRALLRPYIKPVISTPSASVQRVYDCFTHIQTTTPNIDALLQQQDQELADCFQLSTPTHEAAPSATPTAPSQPRQLNRPWLSEEDFAGLEVMRNSSKLPFETRAVRSDTLFETHFIQAQPQRERLHHPRKTKKRNLEEFIAEARKKPSTDPTSLPLFLKKAFIQEELPQNPDLAALSQKYQVNAKQLNRWLELAKNQNTERF